MLSGKWLPFCLGLKVLKYELLLSSPFAVALRRPILNVQEYGGPIHTDPVNGWVE